MVRSWGAYPQVDQQSTALHDRQQLLPSGSVLPFGNGRSYGDSCLNERGLVVSTAALDKFIAFDATTGRISCEAGVTLKQIIDVVLPRGWFLPVTPGTKFVTVGGAIANDVHGKNHHVEGTFGCHLLRFELLRTDGSRLICSATENTGYFRASIGGLGLTGMILWAELQLKPVANNAIDVETIKYAHLRDFFALSAESDSNYEYTVAWLDCLASGTRLGRGHFMRGNHAPAGTVDIAHKPGRLAVPLTPPVSLINQWTLKAFNQLYYHRQRAPKKSARVHYDPFFYPLDGIKQWNRIYGRKGFLQFQCAIPQHNSESCIAELLQRIVQARFGSFLVVLKMFGSKRSPGLLSFPLPGATLALDFPFVEGKTLPLFAQLDKIVIQAGGRLYPAKDAAMSRTAFQRGYPQWHQLETVRDPNINSDFWRRITGEF
jgi:FAD/FMN-containing dehydrogenase